jgi:hypothetical protein
VVVPAERIEAVLADPKRPVSLRRTALLRLSQDRGRVDAAAKDPDPALRRYAVGLQFEAPLEQLADALEDEAAAAVALPRLALRLAVYDDAPEPLWTFAEAMAKRLGTASHPVERSVVLMLHAGRWIERQGDLKRAVTLYTRAFELADQPGAHDDRYFLGELAVRLARLHHQLGDRGRARSWVERLEKAPTPSHVTQDLPVIRFDGNRSEVVEHLLAEIDGPLAFSLKHQGATAQLEVTNRSAEQWTLRFEDKVAAGKWGNVLWAFADLEQIAYVSPYRTGPVEVVIAPGASQSFQVPLKPARAKKGRLDLVFDVKARSAKSSLEQRFQATAPLAR